MSRGILQDLLCKLGLVNLVIVIYKTCQRVILHFHDLYYAVA